MTERELMALIRAYRDDSLGVDDGDLSNERAEAMDRYHGRPYGDEEDGLSKIVTKDLSETVDWIMPAIMESLFASGSPVEFIPNSQDDEEAAQQQTDYVNHVIMHDNQGFIVVYDAVKDMLLLKNGYVKHWWDESEKITEEEYQGLTPEGVIKLFTDLDQEGAEVEVLEQEEITNGQATTLSVRLKITKKTNRERLEAVPAEEIRVSKRCRGSTQTSPFVEHVTTKTRSELLEMGMDDDFVAGLPGIDDTDNDQVELARNTVVDETDTEIGVTYDKSMDSIQYSEAYLLVDWDGDGKAELRKVITVNDKIPPGKEWNEIVTSIGITGGVAKRVPHRHVAESLHDEIEDLQRINTTLMRQALDNVRATNNSEYIINERANLSDFTSSIAGGVKRVKGKDPVNGAVMPHITQPVLDQIIPMMDRIDKAKGARTGINETTTAVDPDVLKMTTKGAFSEGLRQASQKVRLIIRMVAETLMKEMALRVHEDIIKYQDVARMIKLRGKYVEIDPTQWRERTSMYVKVGLGTGTEEEKRSNLMLITQLQQQMAQQGLVTPNNSYKLFKDIADTMGIVNPDKYVLDPSSEEFQQIAQQRAQQEQPNPLAEAEQVKGEMQAQIAQLKGQQDLQIKQIEQQSKADFELFKARVEMDNKQKDRDNQLLIEQMKIESKEAQVAATEEVKAMIAGLNIDLGKPGIGTGLDDGR